MIGGWYITWYIVAHFRWMGYLSCQSLHVIFQANKYRDWHFTKSHQIHFENCTTPILHWYYKFISSNPYKNFQKLFFCWCTCQQISNHLNSNIFLQISMSCFLRKNMVSQSFWKCFSLITWSSPKKKCFKSWNDHNWFWSAR